MSRLTPIFNIVLHEPEIPQNTGNIGRTCIATRCSLHLIHPLGFQTSEKACRRAGLDYWPRLAPVEHASWDAWCAHAQVHAAPTPTPPRVWLFTTKATTPVWDIEFHHGDWLVFGKETSGLPASILARFAGRLVTFPMMPGERSLNLATAVCGAVYEGMRQLRCRGELALDGAGRIAPGGSQRGHRATLGPGSGGADAAKCAGDGL